MPYIYTYISVVFYAHIRSLYHKLSIKRMYPEENTQATSSESDVGEENILTK